MWNQLNDEQKKSYGEDYYEAAMTSVEKYSREVCIGFYAKNLDIYLALLTFAYFMGVTDHPTYLWLRRESAHCISVTLIYKIFLIKLIRIILILGQLSFYFLQHVFIL